MLASPSIQSSLLTLIAPASPEISASAAMPSAGFDVLLAAIVPAIPVSPAPAAVAALPSGGNTLPVTVAAVPSPLEFVPELPRDVVVTVPAHPAQPQLHPGTVLPRALAGTALSRITSPEPATPVQPVATPVVDEHSVTPVAPEAAAPVVAAAPVPIAPNPDALPVQLAVSSVVPTPIANAVVTHTAATPIEQATQPQSQAQPQAHAPAATGPRRSPKANPAEQGIVQPLTEHPAPAVAANAKPAASLPVVPVTTAPILTTPVEARPARPAQGHTPHVTQAPGLIRAAARANPAAGFTPAPLAPRDPALPQVVDVTDAIAVAAPQIAKHGPALLPAHQPAAVVTDLRSDPSPRAASLAAQITLDPALLRPVPVSDAIALLTASTGEPAPAISAYIGPARSTTDVVQPLDFAALIDRIESAREAGGNAPVTFSLRHEDFGPVSLRVEAEAGKLSVDLSSPDPDFARAVAAAQPAASDAPRNDTAKPDSGRSDNARGEASARGQDAPSGNARDGGGTGRGSSDDRGNRAAEARRSPAAAKASPDQTDLFA